MKRVLHSLAITMALLCLPLVAHAQSCAVSVSLTTTSQVSTSCFVPANGLATVQITGTWVGTADVQRSINGGAVYKSIQTTIANDVFRLDGVNVNSLIRVIFTSRTSGTLTGNIYYNVPGQTKFKIKNVEIGSVAYGSFGNNNAGGGSTKIEVSDGIVPSPGFYATGVGVLFGATTGNGTSIIQVFDGSGNLVANSATAGVTDGSAGANAFTQIPFTVPIFLPAGRYYVGLQLSGTMDTYRSIAANTFIDVVCGEVTGNTYGTVAQIITPPTTCTANIGPIWYFY